MVGKLGETVPIPVISVVGWHNVGKTTFVERLVRELKRRGLRVATVKHTRGDFQVDHEGTDTWRFARAGSDVVVIVGQGQLALIEQRQEDLSLGEILARLPADLDLVITEGYKQADTLKIEVAQAGAPRIASPEQLLALITTEMGGGESIPRFTPEEAVQVVDLLDRKGLLRRRMS